MDGRFSSPQRQRRNKGRRNKWLAIAAAGALVLLAVPIAYAGSVDPNPLEFYSLNVSDAEAQGNGDPFVPTFRDDDKFVMVNNDGKQIGGNGMLERDEKVYVYTSEIHSTSVLDLKVDEEAVNTQKLKGMPYVFYFELNPADLEGDSKTTHKISFVQEMESENVRQEGAYEFMVGEKSAAMDGSAAGDASPLPSSAGGGNDGAVVVDGISDRGPGNTGDLGFPVFEMKPDAGDGTAGPAPARPGEVVPAVDSETAVVCRNTGSTSGACSQLQEPSNV